MFKREEYLEDFCMLVMLGFVGRSLVNCFVEVGDVLEGLVRRFICLFRRRKGFEG